MPHKKIIFPSFIFLIILIFGVAILLPKNQGSNNSSVNIDGNKKNFGQDFSRETEGQNNCQIFGQNVIPPQNSTFASSLTDTNLIDHISPGDQVGDKRFTYLWIKGNQSVPIYAPANGTLVQIEYKTRIDLGPRMSSPDYDLVFLVDCNTFYRINHITAPSSEITNQAPVSKPIELKIGSGINDNDVRPKENITVKAGEQIGTTTGTPTAHNFDFGIFVNQMATCPYDKFSDPIKSSFLSLFQGNCNPTGNY